MYSYKSKDSYSDMLPVLGKVFLRLVLVSALSLGLAFLVQSLFLFVHRMDDNSMLPSFSKGERVWMRKGSGTMKYGHFVLAQSTDKSSEFVFVGRIVGLPGDKISIKKKKVYRNGKPIEEKIQNSDKRTSFPESLTSRDNQDTVTLRKDSFFILCDNRDECMDSRIYGPIHKSKILATQIF